MSWGRVSHPSELFKVNDEIDVIVLKYDPATERVSLGHKQLMNDPWSNVIERYPVGARMSGKVVSLTDYGAFVELEPGVEGLIHVSEMSWSKRVKHPSKILNVGDTRRGDGARRRSRRAPHLARPEAGREQPVARADREVPDRHDDHRQGAQPDRVRRVRRGRGGHRRPDPHLRHVVEQAAEAPVGGAEEGRHASRRWCSTSTPRTSGCRSGSSSCRPTCGTSSSRSTTSATSSRARSSA